MSGIIKQGILTSMVMPSKDFYFQGSPIVLKHFYIVGDDHKLLGPKELVKWTE